MKLQALALPVLALGLFAAPQLASTTPAEAATVCYHFGNQTICYETGGRSREVPSARVCFYIDPDFSDRHFCEAGSRTVNVIRDEWKHGVESIELGEGSEVRVCSEPNMQGLCMLFGDNVRELPPELANNVNSYRTQRD